MTGSELEMSREETQLMQGILEGQLATLDFEINHTDHGDFKRRLKERRSAISHLLERLSTLPADEPRRGRGMGKQAD